MQVDGLKAFEQLPDRYKMVGDLLAPHWGGIYTQTKVKQQ